MTKIIGTNYWRQPLLSFNVLLSVIKQNQEILHKSELICKLGHQNANLRHSSQPPHHSEICDSPIPSRDCLICRRSKTPFLKYYFAKGAIIT